MSEKHPRGVHEPTAITRRRKVALPYQPRSSSRLAMPPCQLSEEILQDEPLIDSMVKANRPISTGMHIIHLGVKLRRGPPVGPTAFRVHHYPDGRRIAERSVFDRTVSVVKFVPFHQLIHQVLAEGPFIVNFLDQFGVADGHSFVDRAGDLPQFDF
jgi:hypothetical protein